MKIKLSKSKQLQRNALEDWYGKLRDDGSFPHQKGEGALEEDLACLRMLARFFDLPFRRDVLRRILQNIISSTQDSHIGIQSIAAILDLLSLRATKLKPSNCELFLELLFLLL